MLNFDFYEKGMGIVSPSHFVYDLSKKLFLILYSINWINFIIFLQVLGNMYIAIVCFSGFQISFIFLIKAFFYMTQKSRQKSKYFENEGSF